MYAELNIDNGIINIKQLGAKESLNNENDITNILLAAWDIASYIYIPEGEYYIDNCVFQKNGKQNKIIAGSGKTVIYIRTQISFKGSNSGSYGDRICLVTLKDLILEGAGKSNTNRQGTGLNFSWFGECYIENCYLSFLNKGIALKNGSEMAIKNTIILGCNTGIEAINDTENNYTDIDAISIYDSPVSNCNTAVLLDSVRGVSFFGCSLINRESSSRGVWIKSTYAASNNINFTGCEFENNSTYASIISGTSSENYSLQTLNITQCKFSLYADGAIDIYSGSICNIIDSIFSFTYPYIIILEESVSSSFRINLSGNYYSLPTYIKDLRTDYNGVFLPNNLTRLNFYPYMDHSISEYGITIAPVYDATNKNVSFANEGYLAFDITPGSYDNQDGIAIVFRGINLDRISYVQDGNVVYQSGRWVHKITQDNTTTYYAILKGDNITSIRFYVKAASIIKEISVYGKTKQSLPLFGHDVLTNQNYIGQPNKGDIFATKRNTDHVLYVWNGTSYSAII